MKKMILAGLISPVAASILALSSVVFSSSAFAGDAAAGQTKAAACGGCHGMDGNSPLPDYPKLAGQNEAYIVKQVADFKANTARQNPIMFGMVAALSDQDAADIGAYFQSQTLAAAAEHDADKAAAGRELYKGGNLQTGVPACQACHGPTGSGTAGIGYPQIGGQHTKYTMAQLKAFKGGTRANDDKQIMRNIVGKLSDAEMEAVAHYVASLK